MKKQKSSRVKGGECYRPGAVVVLRRPPSPKVLLCHRLGSPAGEGWQFPQGGVDPEKDLIEEARRELREEIGTDRIRVVTVSRERYGYDFIAPRKKHGEVFRGQRHYWILADLLEDDSKIYFDYHTPEFDDFRWVVPEVALSEVVSFKKHAYRQGLTALGLLEHQ